MLTTSGVSTPFHCHDADEIGYRCTQDLVEKAVFWKEFKGDEMLELNRTWSKSLKNMANTVGKTS